MTACRLHGGLRASANFASFQPMQLEQEILPASARAASAGWGAQQEPWHGQACLLQAGFLGRAHLVSVGGG